MGKEKSLDGFYFVVKNQYGEYVTHYEDDSVSSDDKQSNAMPFWNKWFAEKTLRQVKKLMPGDKWRIVKVTYKRVGLW